VNRGRRQRRRRQSLRGLLARMQRAAAAVLDPTMPRDRAERALRELVTEAETLLAR